MSVTAENMHGANARDGKRPPVKNVVLRLKRFVSWQKLIWVGLFLGWCCIAISLKQGGSFALAMNAGAEIWKQIAAVITICLFIVAAHVSAYYIGLSWSAQKWGSFALMGIILILGEGVSIYTSTAMFANETFTGIQNEVDNSAQGQMKMRIANARINAATGQLSRLGGTDADYVSVTDTAAINQYAQLDVASAEIDQANDASKLSPLQKSLDMMQAETHITPFMWAGVKAIFLSLFPLTMTIFVSNLVGKRRLTIDIDESEEPAPKKP